MSFDIAPDDWTPSTTVPASPPPEVYEAMGVAAQAYDNLQAEGRQMRFKLNQGTAKLVVGIHDLHGNLLFEVPASKALDVAGGGSVD